MIEQGSVEQNATIRHETPIATSGAGTGKLLRLEDLPAWQVDNEYILTSYRPISNSFRQCFSSVFAIHNETVNIHSHLIGALIFVFLPVFTYYLLWAKYSTTTAVDVAVFTLYYGGVAACFFLSSTYHTINNHSLKVSTFGLQLDYLGIVLLQWGATIPTVYYGFYYDRKLQIAYWTVVSVLAVICAAVTVHPKFSTRAMRPYRAVMYGCLGGSAIVFIIHGIALHGFVVQNQRMSLQWMAVMAAFNFIGAAIYASRLPEKMFPKRFDICGASHQVLHVMVIFAGLAHTIGLFWAFQHIHRSLPQT